MTALWLCLQLTLNPIPASSQPVEVTMPEWLHYVKQCSEKYGVDPNFALAVAECESSCKGKRFRFGKMGQSKYYGPFGIHRCFLSRWDIANPFINTEVGIRALARYKDKRKSLKKYNAAFSEGYWKRIKQLERQNHLAGIFK